MQETLVRFLGQEVPLEKGQATTPVFLGFPCSSAGKRIILQCGRPGFDPWVGKISWKRERLPTPVLWPGEFHGLHSPWGRKESDTTERCSLSYSLSWLFCCCSVFCLHAFPRISPSLQNLGKFHSSHIVMISVLWYHYHGHFLNGQFWKYPVASPFWQLAGSEEEWVPISRTRALLSQPWGLWQWCWQAFWEVGRLSWKYSQT